MARTSALWLRWSLRDLRRRWLQVVSIALTLALGIGTYAALGSTKEWRRQSNDASFAALHMHDLRVALTAGSTAPQGRLLEVLRSIPGAGDVTRARERLLVPTQVAAGAGRAEVVVPATVVGHRQLTGATVDGLYVAAGARPTSPTGGPPEVVLEQKFADAHGLPSQGTVRLPGGRTVRYTGVGVAPEEFLVTGSDPGAFLAQGSFATLYSDLATVQALEPALAGRVNDLVLTVRRPAARTAVAAQLREALARAEPPLAGEVTTRQDSPAYRILYEDIEGDDAFWTLVAALVLMGATLAAVNMTSRVVEAQRREIGIGMALGVRPARLALRPMLLGIELVLVGAALGVVVALLMTAPLAAVYRDALPLPEWRTPLQLGPFLRAASAGVVLPLFAVAWPVWRAVRVQPVEAIRTGHLAARGTRLLPAARWLRLPGRGYWSLPLRNLARTPRRTALTTLAVAAAVTTFVAVGGLLDSFRASVQLGEDELARGDRQRLIVSLDTWYGRDAEPVRQVTALRGVGSTAAGLQFPATVRADGRSLDLLPEVLPADSPWQPSLVAGESAGGLVLAAKAARDLDVGPGDLVRLRYPRPVGAGVQTSVVTIPVAGVHPSPMRVLAYLSPAEGQRLGLGGVVNTVQVLPEAGSSAAQLRERLFQVRAVSSVEDVASMTRVFDDALEQFVGILLVMAGVVMLLALLIAYNTATIAVDERAREHATMSAFGLPLRSLLGLLTVESVVLGVLGCATGIAGGVLAIRWIVSASLSSTLPDFEVLTRLGSATIVGAVLAGVVAVGLAPLLTTRRLRRLDVPSTLRVVE